MKKNSIISLIIIVSFGLIFFIVFRIVGSEKSLDMNSLIRNIKEVKSYSSNITIEVINSKEKYTYEGIQKYKKDVGGKLELKDRNFIFKGEDIFVKDKIGSQEYKLSTEFDEVLKYSFIDEYIALIYTNQNLNFQEEETTGEKILLVDVILPGNNRNLYSGVMHYDIRANMPKKIVIYDTNKGERIMYTYENFNWTDKIDDMDLD